MCVCFLLFLHLYTLFIIKFSDPNIIIFGKNEHDSNSKYGTIYITIHKTIISNHIKYVKDLPGIWDTK